MIIKEERATMRKKIRSRRGHREAGPPGRSHDPVLRRHVGGDQPRRSGRHAGTERGRVPRRTDLGEHDIARLPDRLRTFSPIC